MTDEEIRMLAGNADEYAVKNVAPLKNSPLKGMTLCFLGSSVTEGASSLCESFVEFIAKRNSANYIKEAVRGRTLVSTGIGGGTYVERLRNIDKNAAIDLFICQLSTNDVWQEKPLGNVDSTDTTEICGAINDIIDYANATWHCPVIFYTSPYFNNRAYEEMIAALKEIAKKKQIGILDLYYDKDFCNLTDENRALYMADEVHPTKAGYLKWWTPKFEEYLYNFITKYPKK